jgi:hypothetical protein
MTMADWGGKQRPLKIKVFPKGSARWHLDWFGPAEFPDRGSVYTRPSIRVQLSLLNDGATIPDPQQRPQRVIHRYVTVGTLVILGIGDIWSNQQLERRGQRDRITFDDIEIGQDTTRIAKAGISLDSGAHLLPFDEHPWHKAHTHSQCVEVTLANGQHLIIPCTVLLKFYFGSSSPLLSKLFAPNLKRTNLGVPWRRPQSMALNLHLARGMPGVSAEDIARIVANPHAWKAASMIGHSCLRAANRSEPAYPQTTFPFLGRTTLEVQGLWLHRGQKQPQAFVVHEIHSCSAAFPFSRLSYRKPLQEPGDTKSPMKPGAKRSSQDLPKSKAIQTAPNTPTSHELHERDASHNQAPSAAFIKERRKFPDLANKQVTHFRNSSVVSPQFRKAQGTTNAFSLAGQGSGAPVKALQLLEARRTSYRSPPPAELIPYIRELAEHEHVTSEAVTVDEVDGWTVPMPKPKPGQKKIERACVLAIDSRHQFATIVIPLTSPTEPLFYADLELKSEDDLAELLPRVPKDLKQQLRAATNPPSSSSLRAEVNPPQGIEKLRRALQLFFR